MSERERRLKTRLDPIIIPPITSNKINGDNEQGRCGIMFISNEQIPAIAVKRSNWMLFNAK